MAITQVDIWQRMKIDTSGLCSVLTFLISVSSCFPDCRPADRSSPGPVSAWQYTHRTGGSMWKKQIVTDLLLTSSSCFSLHLAVHVFFRYLVISDFSTHVSISRGLITNSSDPLNFTFQQIDIGSR